MQDREIDQLFKSGFDGFEVEPSGKVWDKIKCKLISDNRQQAYLPYLGIAASVLIVVAIGAYFMAQVNIKPKKPVQNVVAKNNSAPKAIIAPVAGIKNQDLKAEFKSKRLVADVNISLHRSGRGKVVNERSGNEGKVKMVTSQPVEMLAQAVQRTPDVLNPVVPGKETPLLEKAVVTDDVPFMTRANTLAAQLPQDGKAIAAVPVKKHRINSLGDLINTVVSKVDKRKDKLIEFSNTEDDESTLSGINLGIIKIKNQVK